MSNANILTTLYEECEGYLELRALGKKKETAFFRITDHAAISDWIKWRKKDSNLYFAVATRDGKAGKRENIISIPAVWIDIDYKSCPGGEAMGLGPLNQFPLQPTIRVLTGGGCHAYWKLKEPATLDDADKLEAIMRGLASRLNGDMACCEVARILRIPGTKNQKYKPPRPVVLDHCNGTEFSLSDFDDFLDYTPKETPARFDETNMERLSRIMSCRFMQHCQQNASGLTEPEWYSMITQLCKEPGGVSLIHKLSKPYPKYSRKETDEKILHAINSTGPRSCEMIQEKTGFVCEAQCYVKSPAGLAFIEEHFRATITDNDDKDDFDDSGDKRRQNDDNLATNDDKVATTGDNEGQATSTTGLSRHVEEYVSNFTGKFSTRDISEYLCSQVGIDRLSRSTIKALSKQLHRLVKSGRLEQTARGGFRIVDKTLDDLDEGLGASEHRIKLPLSLNELVFVEPKEVILVCGNTDGGKTCFALQVGLLNKTHTYKKEETGDGGFGVYHFVSEMGGVSFRNKLNSVGPGAYEEYRERVRVLRFKAGSIADQIQPDSINIIDYLEPAGGDFREIVPTINGIFENLTTGVAVICVQMRQEYPVGGQGVLWRPRLAVALLNDKERGCKTARILKGKNTKGERGIDGWEMDYWVTRKGTDFHELGPWRDLGEIKNRKKYVRM